MGNRAITVGAGAALLAEATLIHLGRTYGSTAAERVLHLPGDEIVPHPKVVTNHAVTIDAPPDAVWPWLVQMGWHRGGWYTARWVDRLLFPANWPSATRIIPGLQHIEVGDFIPDGAPETECGMIVEAFEPAASLVLHSTSHLPMGWRDRAELDWTWTFVLLPVDDGARTRFLFRSRWTTAAGRRRSVGGRALQEEQGVGGRGPLRAVAVGKAVVSLLWQPSQPPERSAGRGRVDAREWITTNEQPRGRGDGLASSGADRAPREPESHWS